MNLTESFDPPAALPVVRCFRRERAGGFALVVTLLIISLLAVVAVSFLTSMSSERQTADAYTSKTRAEQAAQAGVEAAEAILCQSFRDFPDSATAWDTQQTLNSGKPGSSTVGSTYNEGTSLYLRAMDTSAGVADPQYTGQTPAANSLTGNNPNNLACKTFKLPLISGVPGGYAQLVSKIGSLQTAGTPLKMNLDETDPAKQNFADLNVRRFGVVPGTYPKGDIQGAVGSPPDWTGTPTDSSGNVTGTGVGPKPARAYWVPLQGSDLRTTGRYAFWIEDESFRVNVNSTGNAMTRVDNAPASATKRYPLDPTTGQPYIVGPPDDSLGGALTTFSSSNFNDAQSILDTRNLYPGKFFPGPLAFLHSASDAAGASTFSTPITDGLRYLTTTQSSTLNLTRHGTQRVNLNTTISTVDLASPKAVPTIQKQVDQIVKTLQFHLPKFGQRFYRLSAATDGATLNATTTVSQSPTMKLEGVGDPALIYLYKVAANIRDYIDTDSQPTVIGVGGIVDPLSAPNQPFGDENQPNPVWAIGKEAAPFLQETAIRFRPSVTPGPKGGPNNQPIYYTYDIRIDYYLEFWNMTDHDVYAAPQTDSTKASLNGAKIRITNQQSWFGYPSGAPLVSTVGVPPTSKFDDFTIDLSSGTNAGGEPVVFRAGMATVITTDPDYASYKFSSPIYNSKGAKVTPYITKTGVSYPKTTFFCPIISPGMRHFAGKLEGTDYGVKPDFRDTPTSASSLPQDYQTEVTFFNQYGYFDCALFGIAEGGGPLATYTDSHPDDGDYNNYSYGGSLYGNTLVSEMGDPRTNNEQLMFHRFSGAAAGDLSRYYNGDHTLGYPNTNYVQPVGGAFTPFGATKQSTFFTWPDYYNWPDAAYTNPDQSNAPAVIADRPLAAIGQLGDVYDPARVSNSSSVIEVARGGGRTFKIGQRDDRITYDPTGSPSATLDNIPASQGWASWRLTDVFSAGPVDPANPTGPLQESIEQPGRLNINGIARDNGAALRALLTGFKFQPTTVDPSVTTSEPLFHTPPALAGAALPILPTDNTGLSKLIVQMTSRFQASPSRANVPWGPFFERGELGELEVNNTALFGKNVPVLPPTTSTNLANVDLNHTFDRGREEFVRRLEEMICTRGDTFTAYVVGQSILQRDPNSPLKINGTQRMRVTFRLVPKTKDPQTGVYHLFHPAYTSKSDVDPTIVGAKDFDPNDPAMVAARFAKPDRYDVQVLQVNAY